MTGRDALGRPLPIVTREAWQIADAAANYDFAVNLIRAAGDSSARDGLAGGATGAGFDLSSSSSLKLAGRTVDAAPGRSFEAQP